MKKAKKTILMLLCAVLLVTASVTGTVAYLTDSKEVENTFTIGNVTIELKEYAVDTETGKKKDTEAPVGKLENIKLVPGREIEKHPFVTVTGGSEKCWLFVKVENGLAAFEASGATTIENQITTGDKRWTKLDDGVYYKVVEANTADQQFDVFKSVKIADNANKIDGWDKIATDNTIKITAYAIQHEGFSTAALAWAALNP